MIPAEVQQRIIKAITDRGGIRPCSVCGNPGFSLADGYVTTPLASNPTAIMLGGSTLPSVALVCNRCGNTLFLNVFTLGLADLIPPTPTPEQTPEQSPEAKS